jgi:putative transposase
MKYFNIVTEYGQSHYILIKDLKRGNLFFESQDYHRFIRILSRSFSRYGCVLHAYVLIHDHIHLLTSCSSDYDISNIIHFIEQQFSLYFNNRYRRINKLLDLEHAIDLIINGNELLSYYRFIELTPVRIKLVCHPAEYPWSSYGYNAFGEDTGLITPHNSYKSLGCNEPARWDKYRDSFERTLQSSVR